jgi:cyclophilin family peptidyl-prolyl cis-trans isomerase
VPSATSPGNITTTADCPTSQPDPLPAGETRTVTIETDQGPIEMQIEGDLSPIAAGNFVALAACGYYDGVVFHRLVPGFVIQGGDPTGTGTGGPGYTIKDEPVTATYGRGVVAMARTSQPDSVGSQFFIILDDAAAETLAYYNTYQIIGSVTSGMDAVDAIAAMPNSGEPNNAALEPVAMTTVTVTTP